jgi:hypothetical protein
MQNYTCLRRRWLEEFMVAHKSKIAGLICALLTLSGSLGVAQEWPTKSVTLVVPFVAGGTTDLVGRPLAQSLATRGRWRHDRRRYRGEVGT